MMTPNRLKEKLNYYRKSLETMVYEFMNLPVKEQKGCLSLFEKFINDCRVVHEEAKTIKEKKFHITVKERLPEHRIRGSFEAGADIVIELPEYVPMPAEGDTIICTLFSLDEKTWYSSKVELIKEKEIKQKEPA